jgi:hypothetical protein
MMGLEFSYSVDSARIICGCSIEEEDGTYGIYYDYLELTHDNTNYGYSDEYYGYFSASNPNLGLNWIRIL